MDAADPPAGARASRDRRAGASALFGEGGALSSSAARTSTSRTSTARTSTARSTSARVSGPPPSARRTPAAGSASARDLGRGTPARPPARPRPSARPRPAAPAAPPTGRATLVRRTRLTVCVLSALVLVLTGTAWTFYRDVTGGITTTNVITGGSSGGEQNILLVGVDSRTDAQGNPLPDDVLATLRSGAESGVLNSDTIIVLHLPADGGGATAFSIPRDSYVDIPGYRKDKINAAYPATKALKADELVAGGMSQKEADTQSSATGRSTLIETVQNLTGLQIDHYAEINLLGFYNLTQAVGGVDVCLKNPVNDDFSGADFPAGPQTISGADALAFVRQRHGLPEGDLSRIRRQQVFLAAVADKILSTGTLTNPSTLSALIDSAEQSLVIDQGWDLLGFARQASDIAAGNIDFMTIPTQGGTHNERGDVVLVDPTQVHAFVEEKTTPVEESAAPAPPPAPAFDAKAYTLDVGNGSGGTGLAAQVADQLGAAGFRRGVVENAASRTTSVVRYSGDGQAAAQNVAAQLGGLGVEQSGDVQPNHLQVLLGTDYAGAAPATPEAAAAPTQPPAVNAGGVPCID
ncbi:LCP family protein [Pseudonocardia oroxyli]|uniref:Transcriptional attenuator, LytR family n=1 Tax=Pseudonocardia oroxyli TaxID=366584 RepID=A0A1G7VDY8_PSEOR|nr:LCP family protein [Pseudonocardia oroxyli]SDG58052.1 transcriptional attenuator, LytR family [Pseudonocardia oroxyli]